MPPKKAPLHETEIALIKIRCPLDRRTEIIQIAEQFNAKVLDYGAESVFTASM